MVNQWFVVRDGCFVAIDIDEFYRIELARVGTNRYVWDKKLPIMEEKRSGRNRGVESQSS